jgi:uncharacterized membrane protein YphA (DoxX/SURF4 family)
MRQVCSTLNRYSSFAPLVLRVALGFLFLWHGLDKFDAGISMVEGAFTEWGVPAPAITAPLTAVLEVVAGVALILGLATRLAAMLLGIVMVGAIFFVKGDLGLISSVPMPGAELDVALLAGLVSLVLTGPGALALDPRLGIEPSDSVAPREPVLAGR